MTSHDMITTSHDMHADLSFILQVEIAVQSESVPPLASAMMAVYVLSQKLFQQLYGLRMFSKLLLVLHPMGNHPTVDVSTGKGQEIGEGQ